MPYNELTEKNDYYNRQTDGVKKREQDFHLFNAKTPTYSRLGGHMTKIEIEIFYF